MSIYIKEKPSWSIRSTHELKPKTKVSQVFFPTNKDDIDGKDKLVLNNLCSIIHQGCPKKRYIAGLIAVGNTDHRGRKDYNLKLSKRRALKVSNYLKSKLPEALIFWRAIGETHARQPDLGDIQISQQQLAQERRVDIFYGKIDLDFDKGGVVTVPSTVDIAEDAIRIISAKKFSYPNQAKRLLCYLKKLQSTPTPKNDSYWSMSDFEACQSYAYPNGRFSLKGLRQASAKLRERTKSARHFLQAEVGLKNNDNAKFDALLRMDQTIYQSYSKVAAKLSFSSLGGESMFPYFVAVKNTLLNLCEDSETLYSCIE